MTTNITMHNDSELSDTVSKDEYLYNTYLVGWTGTANQALEEPGDIISFTSEQAQDFIETFNEYQEG